MTIPARRQFTVDDYHKMMEAGIFSEFAGEETITSVAVPDLSLVVDAILPGR